MIMKYILAALVLATLANIAMANVAITPSEKLLDAIRYVESKNYNKAVGDNGKAFGSYQIHKAYIEDVNRIYKTNYKHEDAFNETLAREITKKYLMYYGRVYYNKTGRMPTDEIFARIHNGGPSGWKKGPGWKAKNRYRNTGIYWAKVDKALKK